MPPILLAGLIALALVIIFTVYISALGPALIGAPWLPTPRRRVQRALDLADVQHGDVVVDLGSGDGRVLIAAAERGARGFGVEIDPFRVLWSWLRISARGLRGQVTITWGRLQSCNVSRADVVFCYLLQKTNNRLVRKLLRECQPGTRIVAHVFQFPLLPERAHDPDHELTLYHIPPGTRDHV